jgi:ribosome-associated protein
MNFLSLAQNCARLALEKKAENVLILDLQGRSAITDYFVVCSGLSDRQVKAIAEHIADECRDSGQRPLTKEGLGEGRWSLLDFGPVIVHVFQDSLRDHYNLEGLWADAPRVKVTEGDEASPRTTYSDSTPAHA